MGKIILILIITIISANANANASDTNEYYGKLWHNECEKSKKGLATCCYEKRKQCGKEIKNKKDCTPRYKICKAKSVSSTKKTTTIKRKAATVKMK